MKMVGRGSGSATEAEQRDYVYPIFRLQRRLTAEPRPGTYHHLGVGMSVNPELEPFFQTLWIDPTPWDPAARRKRLGKRIGLGATCSSARRRCLGQIVGRLGASPYLCPFGANTP